MRYVPNVITIGRILLTPVLLVLLLFNTLSSLAGALVLFVIAAVSDYVDGQLARRWKARSRLGQFLDPLADKILVLGTFAALVVLIPTVVPWWAVVLIALRDVVITAYRTWAEAHGRTLRTLPIAKAKTTLQLLFLTGILLLLATSKVPGSVGRSARWFLESPIPYGLLLFVVAFTVGTGIWYFLYQGRPYANVDKI